MGRNRLGDLGVSWDRNYPRESQCRERSAPSGSGTAYPTAPMWRPGCHVRGVAPCMWGELTDPEQ